MLPQKTKSDQEVDINISDAQVTAKEKSPEKESDFQSAMDQTSLDTLASQGEDCNICPFHTKKTGRTSNQYSLQDGEMLHDFEGSTASTKTLSTFMDGVAGSNIFTIMNLHARVVSKDLEKCTASFHQNKKQNRYSDIECYEDTRVKIKHPTEPHDYINASWVDGYQERKKFIISQAPLSHTIEHFWNMIWQEKTLVIVSMTQMFDVQKPEANMIYIPKKSGEEVAYGDIKISNFGVKHVRGTYDATTLKVTRSKETRTMLHICYHAWTDRATAANPTEVLNLVSDVNHNRTILRDKAIADGILKKGDRFPVLVHCLSGVGRSCTFAALDILVNKLDDTRKRPAIKPLVDVRDTVTRIRTQRAGAVQNSEHFLMLHLLICEYAIRNKYADNATISSFILDNYTNAKEVQNE